eukprot:m.65669 g.65669  ORF g.65669 m.65669 type:complete len:159 (-) comp9776_c0_seq3:1826-2302(-)
MAADGGALSDALRADEDSSPCHSLWGESQTEPTKYNVIASEPCEGLAQRLQAWDPHRFAYRKTKWAKFADSGMDHIELGGYTPTNRIRRSNVLFLASFHNNDTIMSQFQALVCLCESFIESLTIVLPCVAPLNPTFRTPLSAHQNGPGTIPWAPWSEW